MKKFVALFLAFASLNVFAALDIHESRQEIAGQYRLETGGKTLLFVIRSNGAIEIPDGADFASPTGDLTWNYSSQDFQMDGLPVAHVVIGHGGDEDKEDFHILLTVTQDEGKLQVRAISNFTTFNDGPNSVTDFGQGRFSVSKYDKISKKFEKLN